MSEENLFGLIREFYDSSLDESHWTVALDRYAAHFGAVGAVMHILTRNRSLLHASNNLKEGVEEYERSWWHEDPMVRTARAIGIKEGIIVDRLVLPEEVMVRGSFYQEFLAKYDISTNLGIIATPFEDTTLSIALQSPLSVEYDGKMQQQMSLLSDHITRAAAMGAQLRSLKAERDTLISAYDRFSCGVAMVRYDGTLLSANDNFRALVGRGIGIRRGKLLAESPQQQRALDNMIAGASASRFGNPGPELIALHRQSSILPLLVRGIPVSPQTIERQFSSIIPAHAVMLLAIDAEDPSDDGCDLVLRALGLTRAQARVAHMLSVGKPPNDIAAELRISSNTVRTTIKAIYSKLGVNRQADLARLITLVLPLNQI
ncbi:helix-turn-helix transcriptional regulator [Chthonobacter rhizosphaerae]|uniref:helix-turn-helix transcriptional regulator n=1 Tax=Chthonobacter rhizosphaerae TaxID=2735553 RepID=UPI0015EF930B|nr:helix-turn-helix transcriptional regulator [Chthonobacter rhizosphaerae]